MIDIDIDITGCRMPLCVLDLFAYVSIISYYMCMHVVYCNLVRSLVRLRAA